MMTEKLSKEGGAGVGICRFLVLAILGLMGVTSAFAQAPVETFSHNVTSGGETVTVNFTRFSERGDHFSVFTVGSNKAVLTAYGAKTHRTYIGTVVGKPGAMAAGMVRGNGDVFARVVFEDGSTWVDSAGVITVEAASFDSTIPTAGIALAGGAGSKVYAADLGMDVTSDYYENQGSSVDEVLNMVEFCNLASNLLYQRQMGLTHRLERVVVRTQPAGDPYEGQGSLAALTTLRTEWENTLPSGEHDLAVVLNHTWGGSGYARGTAIIGEEAYSSTGGDATGDFVRVWRHEAGHLWGNPHYTGGAPEGMTVMSGNSVHRVSGPEQREVLDERGDELLRLDDLGGFPYSVPPSASSDTVTYEPDDVSVTIDVLGNDHDANGDALKLLEFDMITRGKGSVKRSIGTGPNGRDQLVVTLANESVFKGDFFTYRIEDASGRTALGYVTLGLNVVGQSERMAWTFDEPAKDAHDCGCCGAHGELKGNAVRSTDAVQGSSVVLDGDGDYVSGINGQAFESDTMTFSVWVKRDGNQASEAGLVGMMTNSTGGINFGTNNELRYHWPNTGAWQWNSGLVPPDGVWTFCALVVTANHATIYMDSGSGMQSASRSYVHPMGNFGGEARIGLQAYAPRYVKGKLDEANIINRALTAAEVSALRDGSLYATNPSPKTAEQVDAEGSQYLTWRAASAGTTHHLYFGTKYSDVLNADTGDAVYVGTNGVGSYNAGVLGEGVYYWRVDTETGGVTTPGSVWMFERGGYYVEAEDTTMINTASYSYWSNYTGTGYTYFDTTAEGLEFSANLPIAGEYDLRIRHRTDGAANGLALTVNGVNSTMNFQNTNGDFADAPVVRLALGAGANTIRLMNTTTGIPIRPDHIELISAANRAPVVSGFAAEVSEGAAAGTTVGAVDSADANSGDVLLFSIVGGNDGRFTINGSSGEISLASSLDYETTTSYELIVRVSDGDGATDTASVFVTVTDVNEDTDGDGILDDWEIANFGNLISANGYSDADGDGLSDLDEFYAITNPNAVDSDGDGWNDRLEITAGSNPTNSGSVPSSEYAGLKSLWKFDESSGSVAANSAGGGNGAVSGATFVTGVDGNALRFDGVNDGVAVDSEHGLSGTTDFSLSVWVKMDAGAGSGTIIQQRDETSLGYQGEYWLQVNSNGTLNFFIYNDGYQFHITTAATVNDGAWHRVIATRVGDVGTIYIDGVSAAQGSGPVKALIKRGISIGYDRRDGNSRFEGELDDLRVYSRGLSNAEIGVIENSAPTGSDVVVSAAEDAPNGSTLGTVTMSDPDGDAIGYSIQGGNGGGLFLINGATGAISLSGTLDYEEMGTYFLVVRGTDPDGLYQDVTVTISVTDVEEPMFLHWKLDDGAGSTASDSSLNSKAGTLSGGATWSSNGKLGGCVDLDGSNDKVRLDLAQSNWGAYTVAFWVKNGATGQNQFSSAFSNRRPSGGSSFQIDMRNGFNWRGASNVSFGAAPVGTWVHLAVRCDGTSTYLYYNGALVQTLVGEKRDLFNTITLGANRNTNRFFKGSVDDLRVYDYALTGAEIGALYSNGGN